MADLKVREAPHLVRRGNSPGVVVNTNAQGYQAAKAARVRAQEQDDIKAELELLRELVKERLGGQS
jgi:hypothetical protein